MAAHRVRLLDSKKVSRLQLAVSKVAKSFHGKRSRRHDGHQKTFQYAESLKRGTIRLFQIVPSDDDGETISCTLTTIKLKTKPEFTAISYAWGNLAETRPINLNGKQFMVTNNLYALLSTLRKEKRPELFWVDAVCINQHSDDTEKTGQVRQMANIYTEARQVLAWLGEERPGDIEAYDAMRDLNSRILSTPDDVSLAVDDFNQMIWATYTPAWEQICALLAKDWFWRGWVIQEFLFARSCTFRCGHLILDPAVFQDFVANCYKYLDVDSMLSGAKRNLLAPGESPFTKPYGPALVLRTNETKVHSLPVLITRMSGARFTDSRDRLFALVGLSARKYNGLVDYGKGLPTALLRLAKEEMQQPLEDRRLDILRFNIPEEPLDGVPSWVPRFQNPGYIYPMPSFSWITSFPIAPPKFSFGEDYTLTIRGHLLDHIEEVIENDFMDLYPKTGSLVEYVAFRREQLVFLNATRKMYIERFKQPSGLNATEAEALSFCFHSCSAPGFPEEQAQPLHNDWIEYLLAHHLVFEELAFEYHSDDAHALERLWDMRSWTPHLPFRYDHIEVAREGKEIVNDLMSYDRMLLGKVTKYEQLHAPLATGRRSFASRRGYIGWIPRDAQKGDLICRFDGTRYPFAIRPVSENRYRLIGALYMSGIMDGELHHIPPLEGEEESKMFVLV